jgi:hypothetical protein
MLRVVLSLEDLGPAPLEQPGNVLHGGPAAVQAAPAAARPVQPPSAPAAAADGSDDAWHPQAMGAAAVDAGAGQGPDLTGDSGASGNEHAAPLSLLRPAPAPQAALPAALPPAAAAGGGAEFEMAWELEVWRKGEAAAPAPILKAYLTCPWQDVPLCPSSLQPAQIPVGLPEPPPAHT